MSQGWTELAGDADATTQALASASSSYTPPPQADTPMNMDRAESPVGMAFAEDPEGTTREGWASSVSTDASRGKAPHHASVRRPPSLSQRGFDTLRDHPSPSVHPYGRPLLGNERGYGRLRGSDHNMRRGSQDGGPTYSSDGLPNLPASPGGPSAPHPPDLLSSQGTGLAHDFVPRWNPAASPSQAAPSQPPRSATYPHTGTAPPPQGGKERARTALNPHATNEPPSLYSIYLQSAHLTHDLRAHEKPGHAPLAEAPTSPAPLFDTAGILPDLREIPYGQRTTHNQDTTGLFPYQTPRSGTQPSEDGLATSPMPLGTLESLPPQTGPGLRDEFPHTAPPGGSSLPYPRPGPMRRAWPSMGDLDVLDPTAQTGWLGTHKDPAHSAMQDDKAWDAAQPSFDARSLTTAVRADPVHYSDILPCAQPQGDKWDERWEEGAARRDPGLTGRMNSNAVDGPVRGDPLQPGDRIGRGLYHGNQRIRVVGAQEGIERPDRACLANQFEVVACLGRGTYAVVYLAHEMVADYAAASPVTAKPSLRSFALKCLSKVDVSQEVLNVQRTEVAIHQSIPVHPNIITLFGALETDDYFFLVLEYCCGRDLCYWLNRADADAARKKATQAGGGPATVLSLLSRSTPMPLLSEPRLRFVSSVFRQMCSAVQCCHDQGVSHRDLKPENFLIEERAWSPAAPATVLVKLTDFGLATMEEKSREYNCGSKPYMAFECRHDLGQTYDPKQADIWALGVILLNLVFHRTPFKEPSVQHCSSFSAFSFKPITFLLEAFDGLTENVARFLCDHVFCDVTKGHARRISAHDFGVWAGELPHLLAREYVGFEHRPVSARPLP